MHRKNTPVTSSDIRPCVEKRLVRMCLYTQGSK